MVTCIGQYAAALRSTMDMLSRDMGAGPDRAASTETLWQLDSELPQLQNAVAGIMHGLDGLLIRLVETTS